MRPLFASSKRSSTPRTCPVIRYLRGMATLVALPLLIVITLLPIMSVFNVSRDLAAGLMVRQVQATNQAELFLPYTEQSLGHAR